METKVFEKNIIESITDNYEVVIWDIDVGNIVRLPVSIISLNSVNHSLYIKIEDGLKQSVSHFLKGPSILKFYIPELKLAFVSELKEFHGNRMELSYPLKTKRLERREHERFEPMTSVYSIFNGIKYEVLDISKGGISLILGASQYDQLFSSKHEELNFEIEILAQKIIVKAQVVDQKKIKPYQISRFPYGAYRIALSIEKNAEYQVCVQKLYDGYNKLINDLS